MQPQKIYSSLSFTRKLNWTLSTSGGHLNGTPVRGLGRHLAAAAAVKLGGSSLHACICAAALSHISIYRNRQLQCTSAYFKFQNG